MPHLTVITREGETHRLEATAGRSVMETLRHAGVGDILATCGGTCSCATCHVYVGPGFDQALPPLGDDENDLLDCSGHRQPTSRLACQIRLSEGLNGLVVTVAPED
jgi:2Fe-2S ferredoxin